MPSREERIEAVVSEAKALIEEISKDGRQAVKAAESTAAENVSRYQDLTDERRDLGNEAERLRIELEKLPGLAYRANMDEEWAKEEELRERYRTVRERLQEIDARLPEVEAELKGLCPNPRVEGGHEMEVWLHAYAPVGRTAARYLREIRQISKAVSDAAQPAGGYFEDVIEAGRAASYSWREQINWLPSVREKLRRKGTNATTVPDRTKVIKADHARLQRQGGEPLPQELPEELPEGTVRG